MVRSLPDIIVCGRDRCVRPLLGLYGQSDDTGKGCGRGAATAREAGASAEAAAKRLCLSVFSIMPHGSDEACHAGLTRIDPIQVWINAERRLIDAKQNKPRDIDPAAVAFERMP
ncbi:hypothetical protein [Bradyrhizobium sp. cf659]|uniref:hypothetical protein n=1 Tax=Bradyrhizobium sp. cf659 TaxID=1761771 RepID=UPI001160E272|nr:hypothetical protein [Bradyrhizobium sp. cf659]